jgi:Binding-protein-dependent transport system inner membrane component
MPLRLFVLASQMLPPVILLLPMYTVFQFAGLINTWAGLIVAHLTINIPFLAWMLVAFFQGEIVQLEQAARVDGATRFQAFWKIAVPVAAPGLLAAGLLAFILGQADQYSAGRTVEFPDPARRRDRAGRRGVVCRHRAGAGAAAVHAQISDQGIVAGSLEVARRSGVQEARGRRQ